MEEGVIYQQEFNAKKRQLLGILIKPPYLCVTEALSLRKTILVP